MVVGEGFNGGGQLIFDRVQLDVTIGLRELKLLQHIFDGGGGLLDHKGFEGGVGLWLDLRDDLNTQLFNQL